MIILVGGLLVPTPLHSTSPQMAFSEMYWAFPVTGRSYGLEAAPGHGQVALGAKKVALAPQVRVPRHFLRPKRHLAMAWRRRRQAMAK